MKARSRSKVAGSKVNSCEKASGIAESVTRRAGRPPEETLVALSHPKRGERTG